MDQSKPVLLHTHLAGGVPRCPFVPAGSNKPQGACAVCVWPKLRTLSLSLSLW